MTIQWFRFYIEVLNDPKAQKLPGSLFKFWVNCLCLACIGNGLIPESVSDIAFSQRVTEDEAVTFIQELKTAGLLDETDGRLTPHNWADRQFKSDSSKDRTQAYRERKRHGDRHGDGDVTVQIDRNKDSERKLYQKSRMASVATPTVTNLVAWRLFVTWASCGFSRDRDAVLAAIDQRAPGFLDAEYERYSAQLDSGHRPDFAMEFVPALLVYGLPLPTPTTRQVLQAAMTSDRIEKIQSYLALCDEDPTLCDPWPDFDVWQTRALSCSTAKAA